MLPKTAQQQIELFHLIFIRYLGERVEKNLFSLKGGCNLRFYFKSIRYSEDLDFDVKTVAKDTLKTQITKLLQSKLFEQTLSTRKLRILDVSTPKQTDTTQRWKLKVQGPGSTMSIPTKIEFSRRGMKEDFIFEPVDAELIAAHRLFPVLCNHYTRQASYIQKIDALIHRSETQARDIFDLNLLLESGVQESAIPAVLKSKLGQAIDRALSISYSTYKSQVVSYLMPEYQDHYGSKKIWDQMQEVLLSKWGPLKA